MKDTQDYPQLILPEGFGERTASEIRQKGWFEASVKTKDGIRYTISFFDPVRMRQELEDNVRNDEPCLAEPNLIIVPELTIEALQSAIEHLWNKGSFRYFVPEGAIYGGDRLINVTTMSNRHYESIDTSKPFLMPVDMVFTIKDRGSVVYGMVIRGRVRVGDELELVGHNNRPLLVSVSGTEIPSFSDPDVAMAYWRDNKASLAFRNIEADRIVAGMVLAKPNTLRSIRRFKAHFNLIPRELGGRSVPFTSGYQPRLVLFNSHYECEVSVLKDSGAGEQGDYWELVIDTKDYVPVEEGSQFALKERHKFVGVGVVTELGD